MGLPFHLAAFVALVTGSTVDSTAPPWADVLAEPRKTGCRNIPSRPLREAHRPRGTASPGDSRIASRSSLPENAARGTRGDWRRALRARRLRNSSYSVQSRPVEDAADFPANRLLPRSSDEDRGQNGTTVFGGVTTRSRILSPCTLHLSHVPDAIGFVLQAGRLGVIPPILRRTASRSADGSISNREKRRTYRCPLHSFSNLCRSSIGRFDQRFTILLQQIANT